MILLSENFPPFYILSHFTQRLQAWVAERSVFQAAQRWPTGEMLSTTT